MRYEAKLIIAVSWPLLQQRWVEARLCCSTTATVVWTLHAQRGRRAGENAMGRSCSAARLDEDSSNEAMVVVISLVLLKIRQKSPGLIIVER